MVRPAFLIIWALLLLDGAAAQQGIRIGPALGYEFGVPLMADRSPGVVNRFGAPGSGLSYNHTGFFGAHLLAPGLIARGIDPSLRFSLALSTGRFISDPFVVGTTFDPIDDSTEIPIVEEFDLYSSLSVAQLDLPVELHVGGFRLGVGPWLSARVGSGFVEKLRIVSPDTSKLPNTPREWVVGGGESLGGPVFRWGGLLSASLPIVLNNRLELRPTLYSRLDAGALADGFGMRSFSAGLGISLLFDPAGDSAFPPPPLGNADTTPRTIPPLSGPTLDVSVSLASDSPDDVAVVRMVRTRHRNTMPLVPVIFFDRGASEIPSRYKRMTKEETVAFSRNSLVQLDPEALYHHTLNVIGMRLRMDPSAAITVSGSVADDESSELARSRAESVRSYLENVWEIGRQRIAIGSAARPRNGTARDEERAITITSASADILEPVVTEWIVKGWRAPQVRLSRSIASDAGVKSWTITVRRGAEIIARYSSDDDDPLADLGGAFQVRHDDAQSEPLVAELIVEDMAGQTTMARDSLKVVRATSQNSSQIESETLVYTFIGDEGNDRVFQSLVPSLHDGAKISIADLSEERSERWSAAQVAGRLLDAIGGSRLLGEMKLGGVIAGDRSSRVRYPESALLQVGSRVVVEQD